MYETSGVWPLKTYSLALPEVEFVSNGSGQFSLSGYQSHGRSLVQVVLDSPTPIAFHRLETALELKIRDSLGTTYFYRNGPLNQHYSRMVNSGKSSWALETEWFCDFKYGAPNIDRRAVSFDSSKEPVPQRTLRCWHFAPTGSRDLHLSVEIGEVPESIEGVVLRTSIRSGWK